MDKKLQDIHINNHKTHDTKVIREVTINYITFSTDYVIIEYLSKDINVIMSVPKHIIRLLSIKKGKYYDKETFIYIRNRRINIIIRNYQNGRKKRLYDKYFRMWNGI